MLDYDELFYKFVADEGSGFTMMVMQDTLRFNDKWPRIDKEEVAGCFRKVMEFLRVNKGPITPQLLELEEVAKMLSKVRMVRLYAHED